MSAYLSLVSKAPAAAPIVLVDGPPYSPWVLVGKDIGNPTWEHQFSGARGTLGRRAAGAQPMARTATFGLIADDQANKDELSATLSALVTVVDEVRRFGGYVTFREHNQTHLQALEVMVGEVSVTDWGSIEYNSRDAQRPAITLTCGPYVLGEELDVSDGFTSDTLSDFTTDAGAASNLSAGTGALVPLANVTTENVLVHTARGYLLGDHEVTAKATPGTTLTNFRAGVVLKRIDASNRLEAVVSDNGSASTLEIRSVVAGTPTLIASTALTRIVAGTPFWIRGRLTGGRVEAFYFTSDPLGVDPTTGHTATAAANTPATFTTGTRGRSGLVIRPAHLTASITEFESAAFVYPRESGLTTTFGVARYDNSIEGDAPAIASVEMLFPDPSLEAYTFGLFAWWRKPAAYNLIAEGGFESTNINLTQRWSVAAVGSFIGAGTSITRTAVPSAGIVPKYGNAVGVVVNPATANVGVKHPIYGTFRQGETYTARVWVRAPSGTTAVRLRLGDPAASGAIASSTAVALSTTWVEHSVTWTCTASTTLIYVGVEQTAATATTFHIDGVQVYRGSTAPTSGRQAQGQGAFPPFGVVEAEQGWGLGSNLAVATSASASAGSYVRDTSVSAGGEAYTVSWMVDPGLVLPDDYADGSVSFVVFARYRDATAFTGDLIANLSASAEDGTTTVYTDEFGSGNYVIAAGAGFALTRMGTLTIPIEPDGEQPRWRVRASISVAAGTNLQEFGIDTFIMVPARSHLCGPTGKDLANYPSFVPYGGPSATGVQAVKVAPDTSAQRRLGLAPYYRSSGLGGSTIELPPGEIETLALAHQSVPDEPDGYGASAQFLIPKTRLRVRPRWSYIRDAPSA